MRRARRGWCSGSASNRLSALTSLSQHEGNPRHEQPARGAGVQRRSWWCDQDTLSGHRRTLDTRFAREMRSWKASAWGLEIRALFAFAWALPNLALASLPTHFRHRIRGHLPQWLPPLELTCTRAPPRATGSTPLSPRSLVGGFMEEDGEIWTRPKARRAITPLAMVPGSGSKTVSLLRTSV